MRMEQRKLDMKRVVMMLVSPLVILGVTQALALTLGDLCAKIGMPAAVGNVLASIMYPLLATLGLSFLCEKCMYEELDDYRITGFRFRGVWAITAVIMPAAVSGAFLMMPGEWSRTLLDSAHVWDIITGGILFYGFAAGIVEEMVFRGVIMGTVENQWGIRSAIIVPSIVFGAVHIVGSGLGFLGSLQVLIAGSVVGILFSLITYESGTIWCSAVVHGIWNIVIIGGILHIGTSSESDAIFNYVLDVKSSIITGGGFGIEASVVSIAAYLCFAILAARLVRKNGERL